MERVAPSMPWARAAQYSYCWAAVSTSTARHRDTGLPTSWLSRETSSSARSRISWAALLQDAGPVAGRHPRPRAVVERLAGVAYGDVDVRGVGLHHRGEDLPGRGVDHVAPHAGVSIAPGAADEQLSGRELVCLLTHHCHPKLSGFLSKGQCDVAVVTLSMARPDPLSGVADVSIRRSTERPEEVLRRLLTPDVTAVILHHQDP